MPVRLQCHTRDAGVVGNVIETTCRRTTNVIDNNILDDIFGRYFWPRRHRDNISDEMSPTQHSRQHFWSIFWPRQDDIEKCCPKMAKNGKTMSRNCPFLPQNVVILIKMQSRRDGMTQHVIGLNIVRKYCPRTLLDNMLSEMSSETRQLNIDKNVKTVMSEARRHRDDMAINDNLS